MMVTMTRRPLACVGVLVCPGLGTTTTTVLGIAVVYTVPPCVRMAGAVTTLVTVTAGRPLAALAVGSAAGGLLAPGELG